MNGVNGSAFPQSGAIWQEHRTADGRSYYYNTATKATQWTKPEDMMTGAERALANQPWKEYTAEGGRKYWYNTETKQSSWEMPDVYKRALGGGASSPATPVTPATPFAPAGGGQQQGYGGGYGGGSYDHRDQREHIGESRQLTFGNNVQAQAFVPASNEPEYATVEEAEAAFVKLLRRSGVQPDWPWEQALRAIVKDAQYRAIKDPKDRKAAFEKYCRDVITQDKERARDRLIKLRADFATMLRSHPEIKHYTRWKTARPIIEGETIFRSTNDEAERRQLFEDYIVDLKKAHKEQQVAVRKSAMDGLIELLPKLNLEPYTRWSEAQDIIEGTVPFQEEEKYKSLSKYDILTVFQNHIKALERTFNDSRQEEKNKKLRKERLARDGFVALLQELRKNGDIKAGTKWSRIYPLIKDDNRYKAMAGRAGSTPMELFWDILEEEERALRGTRNEVLDVIEDKRFEITPKTTFQEFESVVKEDRRTANIDHDILTLLFERLQDRRNTKRSEEDKLTERQQRRALDDLRSFLKRMDPPISVDDTYEKIKGRLAKVPEFQAVTSEEARSAAFEKHIRRLNDREEDDRRRKDRGDRGDRDGHRDRDSRGEKSHRNGRSARSRSPEHDTYEADRRKAIAERERNYRKTSMAESLLSERRLSDSHYDRDRDRDRERDRDRDRDRERDRRDHRDRDRERDRDRDRDYDRRSRHEEQNHYDRDRRNREEERERSYRKRVNERDADELPYGDERPSSSSRRRRGDDDDYDRRDGRESKRVKLEISRERTPHRDGRQSTRTPQKEKTPSIRAGSEEGEIEED